MTEYLDIENRNEFIRKTNSIISVIDEYLNLIKQLKPEIGYIDNVGQLYFDKILEIEKIYKNKNLNYFELQENILNRMIDCCLYNYVEYNIYILRKITIMVSKFYGLPLFNKLFDIYFQKCFKEYNYICNLISNFSIEGNFIDAFLIYIEYSSKVYNKFFSKHDAEQLNIQLSNLGIENLMFDVENMLIDDNRSKVKINVIR